jgi:hypothetical protein
MLPMPIALLRQLWLPGMLSRHIQMQDLVAGDVVAVGEVQNRQIDR